MAATKRPLFIDRGSGPPLVLLHAFPFDAAMWRPQVDALATTHRVIAPELLGLGIEEAPKKIIEVLDALAIAEPVVLGGLSMGGYMAMAFARQFPQRLRGLILADTKAAADDEAAKAGRAAMIALAKSQGSAAVARAMLPKLLGETTRIHSAGIVENVLAMSARQPAASAVKALEALRDRPDATPGLNSIAVPTLVLVGEEDVVTPPALAKIIAENVRGARLVRIPKTGHLSNLEQPAAFNAAVSSFCKIIG